GFFSEADFWAVQARLETLLGGDLISTTYVCPEHPEKASDRRKPGPGLLFEAARDLDVSLVESFMIGDKASDIEAGLNAGVKACVWITGAASTKFADRKDVIVVPDFKSAADWILSCPEGT
ncbi:MAG TPA: HAD hydrolase-like protein, partial [Chthoniobacterales bacterium]